MSSPSVEFCPVCGEPTPGQGASDHCEALVDLLEAARTYVSQSPHPANEDWWRTREELRAIIDDLEEA